MKKTNQGNRTRTNPFMDTRFQKYFKALTAKQKASFAKRVGTSVNNIYINWMRPNTIHPNHRKLFQSTTAQPKSPKMVLLAKATQGHCKYKDMVDHFYHK